jgi:hypothetical protein
MLIDIQLEEIESSGHVLAPKILDLAVMDMSQDIQRAAKACFLRFTKFSKKYDVISSVPNCTLIDF